MIKLARNRALVLWVLDMDFRTAAINRIFPASLPFCIGFVVLWLILLQIRQVCSAHGFAFSRSLI